MKRFNKTILAIVIILSIAFGVLWWLSADDGVPNDVEVDVDETEEVQPAPAN